MRHRTRILLAAAISAGLFAAALPQAASAAFSSEQLKCRSTISKAGGKYAKTVQKAITGCHKQRDKEGPNSLNCNDLDTADIKVKVPTAATKFESSVVDKCPTGTPSDVLYDTCPASCGGAAITTFDNLADCLICLTNSNEEGWADTAYGTPTAPIADEEEADCHKAITKNGSKLFNSVIKTVAKCQANFEKNGSETISASCVSDPGFSLLTDEAYGKARVKIEEACTAVTLPSATFDACGGEITAFDLSLCVVEAARNNAQELVIQYMTLDDDSPVTTTTTTQDTTTTTGPTTTTTLPLAGDPQCPNLGELVLYSKNSNVVCTSNVDCTFPRFCNTAVSRCETVAELDSGWNGAGHDSDINDQVKAMANLLCPGPASPDCGECLVTGLSPEAGNCRCANSITTECDEPLVADNDDCGGQICNCYFGAPFPLVSQGTPVCVSNKFSADITGTANPDLGSGEISASLRASVFLGYTTDMPCAVCGGKCSNDNSGCIFDADCDGGATCVQDVPGDGIRNGQCIRDASAHTGSGEPCEVDALNASFPARLNNPTPGLGGGGYSIDCQPNSPNVAGQGLKISLQQTTGVASLTAGIDCDAAGPGTALCPCNICNIDPSEPCDSNADCAALYKSCTNAPNDFGVQCMANSDCTSINLGPCQGGIQRCRKNTTIMCATNADCQNRPGGTCDSQTCSGKVTAAPYPEPNFCSDDICSPDGGNEGTCSAGPNFLSCDGMVKADGIGINACLSNSDCGGGLGNCTVEDQADCFLDPIVAQGDPDPDFPVAAAVFCIPPTSNGGVNNAAGLPGPGRVVSQGAARTFCASDNNVEYNPGGMPACP